MIYRAIIDDVMANIKADFDDHGVNEDIIADLQNRWENKVVASRVAEFEAPPPQPATATPHPHYAAHLPHPQAQPLHAPYPTYLPQPPPSSHVKAEPVDNRFPMPSGNLQPYMPTLPGPTLPGPQLNKSSAPRLPVQGSALPVSYQAPGTSLPNGVPRSAYSAQPSAPSGSGNGQGQGQPHQQQRMPQVDGPSSSASDSPSPSPSQSFAPRASHPSLPQPPQASNGKAPADSEEINSDLDDSDTDAEEEEQEGTLGETDIVFCTYDKVARVKNKWKCVLKDGMIHINGKDYLFAKCTCEFEW